MLNDDVVNRFITLLTRQGVSVKDNNFLKGRAAFNGFIAAENFLGALGEDLSMTYDLINKARLILEQKQRESHSTFIPSNSTIPELYTHTSEGGITTYWVKRNSDSNVFTLISHDLGAVNQLVDAIIRLMTNETREKLIKLANELNISEGSNKHSLTSIVHQAIDANRQHSLNILENVPKTFTTDPNTPARIFFDTTKIPREPKETPAWDSITNRMIIEDTNLNGGEYFKAFIWSVFEERDKNRVFLYWYDEGNQGKSEVINILEHSILKGAAVSFDFLKFNSHSAESLISKRLIIQHEAVVKKLSSIPIVKQITGRDSVVINPKGKKQFSIQIDAKIIVLSNQAPIVSSQGSELSRLLPIKNKPRNESHFIPFFSEKLQDEVYDFLGKCKKAYMDLQSKKQKTNFLSIEEELSKADTFLDYAGQLADLLEARYDLVPSAFGSKWKAVQTIINKLIDEDDSFKGNISSGSPQLLDFLAKWAKKHGGGFIRTGNNKGFNKLIIVKKDDKKLETDLGDL